MGAGAERVSKRGPVRAAMVVAVLGAMVAGCSSSSPEATVTTTKAGSASTTAASSDATTTTTVPATSASTGSTATTALPDASVAQRTSPGDGTGTALLKAVRIGSNPGFERIVFEFAGTSRPGYRIEWVDGPITADGSGEPVEVAGDAHLEMVMQPASGVDLSAPSLTIVYDGPDRIATSGQTELITDLVRTGDFEAVLTWVAGATKRVPFRVLTLTSPTRVVVDLAT